VTDHPGFHVDAFISLMMSYEAIAEDKLGAKTEIGKKASTTWCWRCRTNTAAMRLITSGCCCGSKSICKRGHVPPQGLILVAFADVQMRGIWLEVMAIAPNRETWCVDALYIDGDTSQANGAAFTQLKKETLDREFPDAFGACARSTRSASIPASARTSSMPSRATHQRRIPDTGAT
jgi:phage terminase large subunit GpA-like protein